MRIAINLRLFAPGRVGGIENYVRAVLAGIVATGEHDLTIFAVDVARDAIAELAPQARIHVAPVRMLGESIAAELNPARHDVLLCPQMGLDPPSPGLPAAAMVTDLAPRLRPDCFEPRLRELREQLVASTVRTADVVLTLSEYSRRTILDAYDCAPERVVVTPCDVGPEFRAPSPARRPAAFRELGLPDGYLFFPANYWGSKNHAKLLAAFAQLAPERPELRLVLTGAAATGADRVRAEIENHGLSRKVVMLDHQPTDVVVALMRNASAMVFPTLFEGFGIPPLEAFWVGTPVVASGVAGNAEVVGDAALLVDPEDPDSIAAGIRRVLDDDDLREDLVARGRARTRQFSWSRTVEIVLRALATIARPATTERITVREPLRVSLVTPVYNGARFLAETIESVLAQRYPYVDYLVVDGGSRDGTLELLRSYDDRVRWLSRPDRGQADAVNRGFEATSGDLFAFLNADDLYYPDALERAVAHFNANPSAALIYGDAAYIDESGNETGAYATRDFNRELLSRECFICQPAAFVTRDLFARAGMLDPDLFIPLDYDLWIRIGALGGPIIHVHERLAKSRLHRATKSATARAVGYREIATVVKRHYGYVPLPWTLGHALLLTHPRSHRPDIPAGWPTLLAALALGLRHNPRQARRFLTEWGFAAGRINGVTRVEDGLRANRDPRTPAGRRGIWLPPV